MNPGTSDQVSKELSAREIFNRIVKGQVVRIPNDAVLAHQIKNHLNVIKSREKKLFTSLGLDFLSSVVCVEKTNKPIYYGNNGLEIPSHLGQVIPCEEIFKTETMYYYEVKLTAPKKRRKYSVFSIQENGTGEPSPV